MGKMGTGSQDGAMAQDDWVFINATFWSLALCNWSKGYSYLWVRTAQGAEGGNA